jgi:transcriptional regulator with XRE-family HTH domain
MPFRRTDEPELEALTRALAVQVEAERVRRGLTQAELAELCGTTQSAVARLERGTRPPRLDTLLRFANALDCELDVRLRPRTRIEGSP